jgi:hypothetical protein
VIKKSKKEKTMNTENAIPIPEEPLNNFYIVVSDAGDIIDRWSDGNPGDHVLTNEDILFRQSRRWNFCFSDDSGESPELTIQTGYGAVYRYRWDEHEVITKTDAEIAAEVEALRLAALPGLVRSQRDVLLAASDWTQLADTALTPDEVAEWAVYRQSLRDITKSPGFPEAVIWPVEPE